MEVQAIQITTDFLHNPPFVTHFSSFLEIHRLWKWGALILAMFAACRSLIRRRKLRFRRLRSSKSATHNVSGEISELYDDDNVSDASSDDEQEAGENQRFINQSYSDEDSCVRGSCKTQGERSDLRQRRRSTALAAWTEFNPGKNVVKLWDSFRLRLDFDEDLFNFDSESVVSTWDSNRDREANEFWESPAISSGAVVFTAEVNRDEEGFVLRGYDSRIGRRSPAMYAEWSSPVEDLTGKSSGGASRVYVRDSVNGIITVGDARMFERPLESGREYNGDTWWDADAVILE